MINRRVLFSVSVIVLTLAPAVFADDVIVDSRMTRLEALRGLDPDCPLSIKNRQELVDVRYYSFDGRLHQGQVLIDERLADDLRKVFDVIVEHKFPIASAIPLSHIIFDWDDEISMMANNTSSFNYRKVTGGKKLSSHARGWAIDINPLQNPYIKGDVILPPRGHYDPEAPGTLSEDHPVVKAFLELGWEWGGHWNSLKDYQHFEKVLE